MLQSWRFLYTTLPTIKKAVTKTGFPLPKVNKYIVTDGKDFAECLINARTEAGFKDKQLLGCRQIK